LKAVGPLGGLVFAASTLMSAIAAPPQADIDGVLQRVGDRVAEFYQRATTVMCTETATVQGIDLSYSPQGFARTVESELRVEFEKDESSEPAVLRKIVKVNGRAPREEDKKNRSGCTDPNPLSSEPLAFLLPKQRGEYRFRAGGTTRERDRAVLTIDFMSADRRSRPELIEDPNGHDDCFDWKGPIASRGRLWVDAETYDVMRVERGLGGPVDVSVPVLIQRRHRLDPWVVIVRDDVTIRYKTIAFSNPDEELLLPQSIDSVTMIRGGLQSTRRSQMYSDYRRFVTAGRVVRDRD
jgi:hypothetical protein